jgi:hypothetical protein
MFKFFKKKNKTQVEVYNNIKKINEPATYFFPDRIVVLELDGSTTLFENPENRQKEIVQQIQEALVSAVKGAEVTLNSTAMSEEK